MAEFKVQNFAPKFSGTKKLVSIDPGLATGGMVQIDFSQNNADGSTKLQILDAKSIGLAKAKSIKRLPQSKLSLLWGETQPMGDEQFTLAVLRAEGLIEQVSSTLDLWQPEIVALESFVDLPSRASKIAGRSHFDVNRWMTPLAIGSLIALLQEREMAVVFQNPRVLRLYAEDIGALKLANKIKGREDLIYEGDKMLKNDHLVTAFAHGHYLCDHFSEVVWN